MDKNTGPEPSHAILVCHKHEVDTPKVSRFFSFATGLVDHKGG